MKGPRLAWLLALCLCGCAGLEADPNGFGGEPSAPAPGSRNLQAAMQSRETLHFVIRSRNPAIADQVGTLSEEVYRKVMFDSNLLSFKPRENYAIVIYKDRADYHAETGTPVWSGGGTVTKPLGQLLPSERQTRARTSIYTAEDLLSTPLLAHEITHLIFNEFMESQSGDEAEATRWLNEGFATYEELAWYSKQDREDFLQATKSLIKQTAMPLEALARFQPQREPVKYMGNYFFRGQSYIFTNIDLWYWQARSVTGFLIERHGQYGFFNLLSGLKQRKDFLTAMQDAYPGRWSNWSELENEWRQSL